MERRYRQSHRVYYTVSFQVIFWWNKKNLSENFFCRAADKDDKCEFAYETLGTIEVQRGNLKKSIELFEKAIPLANTELEMGHLFGLRDAAIAQTTVSARLGITLPGMMG